MNDLVIEPISNSVSGVTGPAGRRVGVARSSARRASPSRSVTASARPGVAPVARMRSARASTASGIAPAYPASGLCSGEHGNRRPPRCARPGPREGARRRAARPRRRDRAAGVRRPDVAGRAGRHRAAAARRHRRGLLRQQPVPEPHERLPGEVQVLRVRHDQQAVGRLHLGHRRPGRPRRRGARARALQRDPHGRRREPAPRVPLLHRPDARAARGAAGRAPEAVHRLRGAPHAQALGQAQAGDPGGAQGRRAWARCRAAAPRCSPTACAG